MTSRIHGAISGIRILVIEDEPAIADTLVYALRTEGFSPEWTATGRDGLDAFAREAFALVVLDVGLPDMSGFDLCRELRMRTSVPVLFLTARSSEIDRVVGLELGGDDYVTKPFSPREVTARVRAILRRVQSTAALSNCDAAPSPTGISSPANPSPPITAVPITADDKSSIETCHRGIRSPEEVCHLLSNKMIGPFGLEVDAECKIAVFCGVRLELTRYEFRLLAVLHSRPGRVWSRDELMTQAWEEPGASLDRTVDAHIKTLRAKLRAITPREDPIRTHRGEGYSLRVLP